MPRAPTRSCRPSAWGAWGGLQGAGQAAGADGRDQGPAAAPFLVCRCATRCVMRRRARQEAACRGTVLDAVLMAAPVDAGQTFSAGTPESLFQTRLRIWTVARQYVARRDGQRFLMIYPTRDAEASPMNVLLNWQAPAGRHERPKVPTECRFRGPPVSPVPIVLRWTARLSI